MDALLMPLISLQQFAAISPIRESRLYTIMDTIAIYGFLAFKKTSLVKPG